MLLAHAGHWAIWVLYAIPVIAVLVAVVVGSIRARDAAERANADDHEPAEAPPEDL
jgi:cytochrome c-type biogenesis protein CcmH/NrfF